MTTIHQSGKDWIEVLKGSEIIGNPQSDDITRIAISLLDREIKSFEYTEIGIFINVQSSASTAKGEQK